MAAATGKSFARPLRRPYRRARLRRRSGRSRRSASWSSSLRDKDQIIASGWWNVVLPVRPRPRPAALPAASAQVEKDGKFVIAGNIFGDGPARNDQRLRRQVGQRRRSIAAGETADLGDGVHAAGQRRRQLRHDVADKPFEGERGQRIYYASSAPPKFTTDNYQTVLFSEGIGRSFINSLTVTIPATVIPILIAAFAAYALAWMRFPGRALLIAVDHRPAGRAAADVADPAAASSTTASAPSSACRSKTYLGIWLAHTGFGLPLRHLSAAQLHRRPAARDHGIGAHRRRQRLRDLRQDRAAAVVPGARLLRDLPVPVGVERPAGRHGLPRHRSGSARADRPSSTRCSARAAATGKS